MGYIYSLLNTVTNKSYIGQAVNLKERKRKHFEALRGNRHFNQHLQSSFNKYGEKVFKFFPIFECEDKDLDYYEDLFIKLFKTQNDEYGYNIRDGGRFHLTENMIQKMTASNQNRVENVLQIDPDTLQIVKVWPSQSQVMKKFPVHVNVHLSCKDKGRLMGGYHWIWEKDYDENWKPYIHSRSNPVIAIDNHHVIKYIFPNKRAAEKELHTDRKNMNDKQITRDGQTLTLLVISRDEYYQYKVGTCIDYPREEE